MLKNNLESRSLVLLFFIVCVLCIFSFGQDYIPGHVYYGRNKYIEYHPGTLPIILSSPHAGELKPKEIPDRIYGSFYRDENADDLVMEIRREMHDLTGKYPHVIICNLDRRKLDANREIHEAAASNEYAEKAWNEFHAYIEYAKKKVEEKYETGFYFDIHGFDEGRPWIQLGYLVGGREFNDLSDEELNKHFIKARSSIKYLAENGNKSFAELTRGRASLGALLENEGYDVVPSPENSGPGHSGTYYNGGYNTARHGSRDKGKINAIQVETPRYGIRDTKENRKKFAGTFAGILEKYVIENMKIDLK